MKLNILLLITTLIMTISGGVADAQDTASDSIFYLLESNPDFAILTSAIESAELDEELSDPNASYTVFAPTDEAFVEMLVDLELEPEDFLNDTALINTLMYHILPEVLDTNDIDAALGENTALFTDTLYEAPVHITKDEDSIFVNGNPLVSADTMANNGVIHALDGVLSPPQTLWNIVETSANPEDSTEAPQFTILAEAIDIAELEADLAVADADFTLFAPTDEAFIAAAESLDLAPADLLADRDFVTSILLSHVVRGELTSVDLIELSVESGVPINLENLNEETDSDLQVLIDDDGLSVEGARIIEADILARNGVIHVIDRVLIPGDS